MSTLLTAHALHVETAFGPLFNTLSFTLKKGDRIGLIGHNGCGKSTLLQVLDGTIAPTSGSVSLAGQCLMAALNSICRRLCVRSRYCRQCWPRYPPIRGKHSAGWPNACWRRWALPRR